MRTVLIIEDQSDIRENTVEILQLYGFRPLVAERGRAGLATAVEEKPDVILCDIRMPDLDGYEVLSCLRRDPATCSIPFIYVTASGEKAEVEKAIALGATAFIRKPFEIDDLMQAINKSLGEDSPYY